MTNNSPSTCLVTVSDDRFAAGTEVLFFSFRRYNPWFRGAMRVIVAGPLSASWRARLGRLGAVEFVEPGEDLRGRVATLINAFPRLAAAGPRFAALETFGFDDCERAVYLDSDTYVVGDVSRLFDAEESLLACPDGSSYDERLDAWLGGGAAAREANRRRYGLALSGTFNAGVVSVGAAWLGRATREQLVALIDPASWRGVEDIGWTDQLVLNRRFAGHVTLLDGRYNYMPILAAKIRAADNVTSRDARIVHMAGRVKPWQPATTNVGAGGSDGAGGIARFCEEWHELAELIPGHEDREDARARILAHVEQMHAVMRPRTDMEDMT